MKPRRRLIAVPAAILLLSLISGCAGLQGITSTPRVSLSDLRLVRVTLVEQHYVAVLRIQNPNDARLDVRGLEYSIDLNGRRFARGVRGKPFSVPAYGEALVEVGLTSSVLRVLEQLKGLSDSGRRVFQYRIHGSLRLAGALTSLPFSHEDEIDLSPSDS